MTLKKLIEVIAAGLICLYSSGVRAEEAPAEVPALMKYLEQHMVEVNRSLIWSDFTGLHAAARAIAQHPVLPMGNMCEGAVTPRFRRDRIPRP